MQKKLNVPKETLKITAKEVEQEKARGKIFLTPELLAQRWFMTLSTLSQWRWSGDGPPYHKMGKRILYDLEKIERFEDQQLRQSTSQQTPLIHDAGQFQ